VESTLPPLSLFRQVLQELHETKFKVPDKYLPGKASLPGADLPPPIWEDPNQLALPFEKLGGPVPIRSRRASFPEPEYHLVMVVDPEAIKWRRRTMYLTSLILHGLLLKSMPDHYNLSKLEIRISGQSDKEAGRRGAAFRAMKALMQKRALLIAPDGPYADDSTSEEIRVFGIPTRVSFSAALFAYEAQCDLGWCSLINENERLVPSYAPGPTRKSGETFARFKDRWLSFYSARLEEAFSSNPKNLALHSSRWVSFALKTKGVAKGDDHVSSNHQISSPGNAPAASNPSRAESN
jgi:hypothetical protein